MKLALAPEPAAETVCTSTAPGHLVDPVTERFAAAAADWQPARLLANTRQKLLVDVDGEVLELAHHDAAAVALAAKYGTVRFHGRYNLLEVGGWMFSVVPLAANTAAQLSEDC